jgi:hypothetical protein
MAGRLLINVLELPVRIRLGQKHVLPQQLLVVSPTLAAALSSINVFVLPSITDPLGQGIGGPKGGGVGGKHVHNILSPILIAGYILFTRVSYI